MTAGAPVLVARGVTVSFGGLKALRDFDMSLAAGELVGLIGPNGAGKTTAFNALTGIYAPEHGEVRIGEHRINGWPPHRVAAAGLSRTFQNIRLFHQLSVFDNVRLGAHLHRRAGLWGALWRSPRADDDEAAQRERATELLAALDLGHRRDDLAAALPYGEQRRLEIARALATEPRVLLLDEPAAGTGSGEKVALMRLIARLRDRFGIAILLIEHDMRLVMGVCERIVVLDHGVTIAAGTPAAVRRDPRVIEAYLGHAAPPGSRPAPEAAAPP